MVSQDKKLHVRILLENIKFKDPYEQQKLEQLKSECEDKAVEQLEALLKTQTLMISFD